MFSLKWKSHLANRFISLATKETDIYNVAFNHGNFKTLPFLLFVLLFLFLYTTRATNFMLNYVRAILRDLFILVALYGPIVNYNIVLAIQVIMESRNGSRKDMAGGSQPKDLFVNLLYFYFKNYKTLFLQTRYCSKKFVAPSINISSDIHYKWTKNHRNKFFSCNVSRLGGIHIVFQIQRGCVKYFELPSFYVGRGKWYPTYSHVKSVAFRLF